MWKKNFENYQPKVEIKNKDIFIRNLVHKVIYLEKFEKNLIEN